jgi:FlaA1/EpsC-like NDP-sugar epimerase
VLPITDSAMTRFNISLEEGVDLVLRALDSAWGGEIFVPKIPSYSITELAKAIAPSCRLDVVGIRPGEKIHEEMITASDSFLTVDLGKGFAILPQTHRFTPERYCHTVGATPVPQGFTYNSGTNAEWLSTEQIRELIKRHVDPTFEPV